MELLSLLGPTRKDETEKSECDEGKPNLEEYESEDVCECGEADCRCDQVDVRVTMTRSKGQQQSTSKLKSVKKIEISLLILACQRNLGCQVSCKPEL